MICWIWLGSPTRALGAVGICVMTIFLSIVRPSRSTTSRIVARRSIVTTRCFSLPREAEELLRQVGPPARRLVDDVGRVVHLRPGLGIELQELRVADDAGEDVVEVVRDASREGAIASIFCACRSCSSLWRSASSLRRSASSAAFRCVTSSTIATA